MPFDCAQGDNVSITSLRDRAGCRSTVPERSRGIKKGRLWPIPPPSHPERSRGIKKGRMPVPNELRDGRFLYSY